jgi:glycosyltransferase involved in cell wall biosynthesis
MKRVYIVVINDLVTDQRLNRVARLLINLNLEVTCIGRRLRDSPPFFSNEFRIRRYRMLFTRGVLFYACFNFRVFFTLVFVKRPDLIIANDLDTLIAAYLASRIRKCQLLYDSHELFTQVPELIHRKRIQKIWKGIESMLVPKLKHAVTVSYPIAEIYRRLYGVRFGVVRNVPLKLARPEKQQLPAAYQGKQLIIYQGALNVGRGLEMMIRTMHFLEDVIFIVAGSGDIEMQLKELVKEEGLEEKVEFKGRMMPGQLIPLTCSCDLGISLEEDLGLSYRYALPNKLFDYVQARIPVLCSALPEMAKIVETFGIGIATGERDPEKLAAIIRYMLDERSSGAWLEALEKAAGDLCWENESKRFEEILEQCGVIG